MIETKTEEEGGEVSNNFLSSSGKPREFEKFGIEIQ